MARINPNRVFTYVTGAGADSSEKGRARNEEQLIANIGAVGWALDADQIKALDAASDTPAAYPVWHQRGFPQLNERNR